MKYNFRRLLSIALLALLNLSQLRAFDWNFISRPDQIKEFFTEDKIRTSFILAATGLSITTVYNYYRKKQAQGELALIRSEAVQKANDENYISELVKYLENINLNFEAEIQLAKNKPNLYHEEYLERIIQLAKQKRALFNLLASTFDSLSAYQNELELKINSWNRKNNNLPYVFKAQEVLKDLNNTHSYFKELNSSLKSQASFIDLSIMLDKNSFSQYNRELTLSKQFIGSNYFIELDKVIRASIGSENIFPYLAYCAKLQRDIDCLQNTLEKIQGTKLFVFQERVVKQAAELEAALKILLENVVSLKAYQEEQLRKPEFEKQQRLLEQELKEREQRLRNEKTLLETKLLEEKNKEQRLINEHAKIEKDRQSMFLQQQTLIFETEKIRTGQALKEEIEKNSKYWKSEIDKLVRDNQKNIEHKTKESQEKILKSEQELNIIKSRLQDTENRKNMVENELGFTKRTIATLKNYLSTIETQLGTPPFNPDIVDGLRSYLNNIRNNALAALRY